MRKLPTTKRQGQVFTYLTAGTSLDTPAKVAVIIEALNTINLTTRSLWRRVFDKLMANFPDRFVGGATVG